MAEILEVYDLDGNLLGLQDRKTFYEEIRKEYAETGKITRKVKTIRLLLMNSHGKVYLQKRSRGKKENPNLFDKTVGGHVAASDGYNITAIRECAEELGFPVSILPTIEFEKAIKITNLSIVGVLKKIDYLSNFNSVRITESGSKFIQPYMAAIYIGYYDGAIRFVDGESSGIEVFSLEELKQEMEKNPNNFTEDIKFMIKEYERFLRPIK